MLQIPVAKFCFFLMFVLTVVGGASSQKTRREELVQWLERAAGETNLESPDSPPYILEARVHLSSPDGAQTEGTYRMIWKSPSLSREKISISGFQEVRVFTGDKLWIKRNLIYSPWRAEQTRQALRFHSKLKLWDGEQIRNEPVRDQNNPQLRCIELASKALTFREMCFDVAKGTITKYQEDRAVGTNRYEFSDYLALPGKSFPTKLHFQDNSGVIFEIAIHRLESNPVLDASAFEPPLQAEAWDSCEAPTMAKDLIWPDFISPEPANSRFNSRSWEAEVYVLLDTDGRIKIPTVVASSAPELNEAIVARIKEMRFHPVTCNGTPVRIQMFKEFGMKLLPLRR